MKEKPPENLRAFKVFAIKEGTVIDHITENALKIAQLLSLYQNKNIISIGLNFPSKSQGKKDIIKIENKELTPEEVEKLAIFAPEATINIIRDYKVVKKFKVKIPDIIYFAIVCPNPKCITNNEGIKTKFYVIHNDTLSIKCHYCEKTFKQKEIREYN